MAGDWIKMRGNLWDDPRVAKLCDLTDQCEAAIVGALYWLWATADQHTEDGIMPGLSLRQIDRKTGIQGFAEALCSIGWLADHPEGVRIIKFEEHNGESAKKRCQTAKRVAKHKKGNAEVTQQALPDEQESVSSALPREREEKSNTSSLRSDVGRATRLPQDWTLPDEWAEWAKTERPDVSPGSIAETFRDYWHAKAGKDGRKADWFATWRNWVRNQRATSTHAQAPPQETAYQRSMRERVESICPEIAAKPPQQRGAPDVTSKTLGGQDFYEAGPGVRARLPFTVGGS